MTMKMKNTTVGLVVVGVAVSSLWSPNEAFATSSAAFCVGKGPRQRSLLQVVSDPRVGIPLTTEDEQTESSSSYTPGVSRRRPTPTTLTITNRASSASATQLPLRFVGTSSPSSSSSSYTASDCDDYNVPPSLAAFSSSILRLQSGSDIRGRYVAQERRGGSLHHVLASLFITPFAERKKALPKSKPPPPLTTLTAHCLGHSFANMVKTRCGKTSEISICVGRDPRLSGVRLADAFCRGVESVEGVCALYTGLATTPSMFEFCRADKCDGAVMMTASHLPQDRNGMKFFTRSGGFTKTDIEVVTNGAIAHAHEMYDAGILPPTSGEGAVFCSQWVDFMPHYEDTLRRALLLELGVDAESDEDAQPLKGLKIVLNAGNGSGYFFHSILESLGADVSGSLNLNPDGTFPEDRVPNPEYPAMLEETRAACVAAQADLGIMLDTDADRCGLVVRSSTSSGEYEALNRNRLIALLSVIFADSAPGCTIVTDSVTSEGLTRFLQEELQLEHVRYLKGYANVIGKAKELTEMGKANAEMAIETSGHCAMKENGYLDDGTYAAVKVIGLLGRLQREGAGKSLLDLISSMEEMPETREVRMPVLGVEASTSTQAVYERFLELIEIQAETMISWEIDPINLEGIRVLTQPEEGGFFMLRKSLHDPLLSLNVEGTDRENVLRRIIDPLVQLCQEDKLLSTALDWSGLESY